MNKKIDVIKNIYLKNYMIFTLLISTFFFILSCFWTPFMMFAWAVLGATFVFSNIQEILCYIIYFIMFSRNTIFFVGVAVIGFIVILVKYVKDLINKRVKTYKDPLIATIGLCIIFSLISYGLTFQGVCQGLLFIGLLFLIYLLFCYRDKINVEQCFNFLFFGIMASALTCLLLYFIPNAKITFYEVNSFTFRSIRELIFLSDQSYKRLMLLSYHPNHLASYCMYIAAFVVHYIINNKMKGNEKKFFCYFLMLGIVTVLGILTISKAFLIIIAIIALYGFVFFVIKYKKESLKLILPAFIVVLILCLCFHKVLISIFERFFNTTSGSILNIITSGRTDIWKAYTNDIFSSPWKVLFGKGIFATEVIAIGPHNIYIEVLFRVGIVGYIGLGVICYLYIISCDKKIKFSMSKCLSLIIFLVHSIQEANFDERFLFLILAIMLLFNKNYDMIDSEKNIFKNVRHSGRRYSKKKKYRK